MNFTTSSLRQYLYLHFPIVEYVFEKNKAVLTKRSIDMNWFYNGIIPVSVSGFNPLGSQIFYGKNSYLEKFLEEEIEIHPNEIDWYLYEIFFVVHDYMHIWAIDQLLNFFPQCTEKNLFDDVDTLNDLAFMLLLSEVVASISVDWWMLSKFDFAKDLDSNSKFRCLTTSFKMSDITIARNVYASFSVQDENFFSWLTKGYFYNVFKGFENLNKENSNNLHWLNKELKYGIKQRELLAKWINFLSNDLSKLQSNSFNYFNEERSNCVNYMASLLWKTINESKFEDLQISFTNSIPLPTDVNYLNFEFIDASFFTDHIRVIDINGISIDNFAYLASQIISIQTCDIHNAISPETFDKIVYAKDLKFLIKILDEMKPLDEPTNLSHHLFIPN